MEMITTQALIDKFRQALDEKWGYIYGMTHVKWSEARQKQYNEAKAGNSDCQRSIQYGPKWYGHWVTDCSGLFAWAFSELGGKIYHGSNTIYKSYCSAKGAMVNGKRKDGKDLQPGTAVFTGTEGSHGHIGLYIGGGYVIEAKGAQYGVVKTPVTDKRWTWWGEMKDVQYDGSSTPDPQPEPEKDEGLPTLRRGSKGKYVTLLQTKLISQGYSCGSTGADGDFGQNTEKAVKLFQQEHDGPDGKALKVDGIVGAATWWALENAPERITYTVTIKHLTAEQKNKLMKEYAGAMATPED